MANPTMTLIGTPITVGSGGASSVTFSSIPATYTDLVLRLSARGSTTSVAGNLYLTFNAQAQGSITTLLGDGTTATSNRFSYSGFQYTRLDNPNANATASTFSNVEFYFPYYQSTASKPFSLSSAVEQNATLGYISAQAGLHAGTSGITSIDIAPDSGSFVQYSSFYLYGISNA